MGVFATSGRAAFSSVFQTLSIAIKIVIASTLVGAALSAFDITAAEVLARAGITPELVTRLAGQALEWALPNMVLGSMVIVPVWFLVMLLRPPRG